MSDAERETLERRIDELCAEVEQGKAEFKKMDAWHSQELKAAMDENAKLRQQLADVTESIGRVEERCAKLREYAKLMHDHIKDCCDCCDEWYCSNWDEDNECCRFDTMMRVCGIEVG